MGAGRSRTGPARWTRRTRPRGALALLVALAVVALLTPAATADPGPTGPELTAVKQRLDDLARRIGAPPEVTAWWADPATASVVLALNRAPGDARAASFVDRARGVDPAVRVVDGVPAVATRADLVGGDTITNGPGRCSVGFGARTLAGAPRMITAGHCTRRGGDVRGADGTVIGPVRSAVFDRRGDWGVVDVGPGWAPTSQVAADGATTVGVTGTATATPGATVCRSGSTTGRRCGTVTAVDVTANYAVGPVEGLVLTDACSEGGDSGGPFLAGRSALGVLSGGSGDCTRPGATSLYQPIEEILRVEGLSLVTS